MGPSWELGVCDGPASHFLSISQRELGDPGPICSPEARLGLAPGALSFRQSPIINSNKFQESSINLRK